MRNETCPRGCCTLKISSKRAGKRWHRRTGRVKKAGAFIYDPDERRVLLVQSRGTFWGCPKGSLEGSETIEEGAIREVREETGLELEPSELGKKIVVKGKATYFYITRDSGVGRIEIPPSDDNDSDGISWLYVDCIQDCIDENVIQVNRHCQILLKKNLGIDLRMD